MIRTIQDVYEDLKLREPRTVAVAQAADENVLEALIEAHDEGYIHAILVGNPEEIRKKADIFHLDISPFEIFPVEDRRDAAKAAVELIRQGKADVLMKGLLQSSDFLKAVLNKEHGIRKEGAVLSAIALVELKKTGQMVMITDLAITPKPDLEAKVQIIKNAVEAARVLGISQPKVAVLSAAEVLNEKIESSRDAYAMQQMNVDGSITDCTVAGPISLDLAISKEAAIHKGYHHPVAGEADILLVPSIETGNALYKALAFYADIETGGIVSGTTAPLVFCSRSDSARTKKNTLALALYRAHHGQEERYE